MPGHRQGPAKREAWKHPQDIVRLLLDEGSTGLPITVSPEEHKKRIDLGWLHDIIEDGKKEDGSPVTMYDLYREDIAPDTVDDVLAMSQRTLNGQDGQPYLEPKELYLGRLKEASTRVKVVKCLDRICNLREGQHSFKDLRWIRYVGETFYFIFPLAEKLGNNVERGYLTIELIKSVEARRIGVPHLPR